MATTPKILNVYPANNAKGIPVADVIKIDFDQEMDLDSLNTGTIVVTGPDEAPVFGPLDITPFDVPGQDDEDILSSPYFKGYVKGTITYKRIDNYGNEIDASITDPTGDGTLWRTQAIFTPDKPLKANVEYKVLILGDEAPTDDFDTGVLTRTVFATVSTITGTGQVTFGGGYSGSVTTGYTVEITKAGATGTAEYIWWDNNDPLRTYRGVTTTGIRELESGVYITCDNDGSFVVGDTYTVVVKPGIVLLNNYEWKFYTGSGTVLTPPSTSSTSGIEEISSNVVGDSTSSASSGFRVTAVSPLDGKYGVAISTDAYNGEDIIVQFSADVDATTLSGSAISLESQTANGDDVMFTATGELAFTAVLTTSKIMTITLDPAQLYTNNIVLLELASTIKDTSGNSLTGGFSSYFSTPYTPLYTGIRRIQLDLGELVTDVPEETIMLAILEASLYVDGVTYSNSISNATSFNQARRQLTTCLAESMLVKGILSGGGGVGERMVKRLGDLSVERGGNIGDLKDTLNRLEDCILTQMPIVQSGGELGLYTSQKPQSSVKGAWAPDAIVVRRQWEPTSGPEVTSSRASGNTSRYASGRRDLKTFSSRNGRGRND